MFQWLKKKLRDWLIEPEVHKDDPFLECVISSKGKASRELVHITGTSGLCLVGTVMGGEQAVTLIESRQAVDIDKFWRLWRTLSGNPKVEWEETPHDAIKR